MEPPEFATNVEFWVNLLLLGSIFVAFAAGVTTIWTRWIAIATVALFFLAYIAIIGAVLVWTSVTSPDCASAQHGDCKAAGFIVMFAGPMWGFFLLVVMLAGAIIASFARWGLRQTRGLMRES